MRDDATVQAIEFVARATVGMTMRALADAMPELDLSLLQWRALLIIGDDPAGARVGQVGDGVGVPLPAASRLVQRLQRRGLVQVERDPDDGRATRVRPTHVGLQTRSRVLACRRTLISEALGHTVLPAEAVQGLRVVAERFERIGREIPAKGTGPSGGPIESPGAKKENSMTRIEYKVEAMVFHEDQQVHREELLAQLNELGKDGWRLVAIDPLQRSGGGYVPERPKPMLLMREVTA